MNLMWRDLRSSKGTALLAVAAGLAGGAGSVGLLAIIHTGLSSDAAQTGSLAWQFALLCLAVLITRVASQALMIRIGQGSVFRLYTHLSRQILATSLRQLEAIGTPRLLAALTEDVPAAAAAMLGVPVLCVNAAILLCCLAYLAWLSPMLFIALLCLLASGMVAYQLPVLKALRHLHRARQEQDALMKHFRGLTEGAKDLQLHRGRREAFLQDLLGVTAAGLRDRNTAGLTLYAAAGTWGQLMFVICLGLLLFPSMVRDAFAREVLSGYVLTILYAASPLETIMAWLPILGRGRVALRAIEGLGLSLEEPRDVDSSATAAPAFPSFEGRLNLVGITHEYDGAENTFSLGPIDLSLSRGELVFVAGGNGSGKTTLAKLLVGLYTPATGQVLLDGRAVTDREQYRQLFSGVFADGYCFDCLLGLQSAHLDERARDYLARLEIGHKVRVEGGRFSTTDLSQGQRKRLALLAAFLEDRPAYVFDEWAADQDPRFRDVFYTRLLPEFKARGKAVLVISHDERYFHVADRVVRLENGKTSTQEARV